jgi:hypothetical protein
LEVDPDGFRVVVDGHEVGTVASNGMLVTLLDPGSHAITLIGLTPNCTIDGTDSRTVAVKEDDMVPVVFAVVCTATSGVVSVVVDVSGPSGSAAFTAALDEARTWVVTPGEPSYLAGVSAGEHGTSLRTPSYCVLQTEAQRISVAVGEVVRDTVEVHFAATCDPSWDVTGIVRITAPTTGSIPEGTRYSVLHQHYGYWDLDGPMSNLGFLEPGGSLVVTVPNIASPFMAYETAVPKCKGVAKRTLAAMGLRQPERAYFQRHFLPWAFDRQLKRIGFRKTNFSYCTYGFFSSRGLESFSLNLTRKLDPYKRSPLGILGTNYIVKVEKPQRQ